MRMPQDFVMSSTLNGVIDDVYIDIGIPACYIER